MSIRKSGKADWLAAVSLAVIIAALLLFTTSPRARLHAQGSEPTQSPMLVGEWVLAGVDECTFKEVQDPDGTPTCAPLPVELPMTISVQKGRAFAGSIPVEAGTKLTGAVAEDGRVVLHAWLGNNRILMSGTISVSETGLEIRGVANEFEDWKDQTPSIGSFFFRARKVR